MTFKCRASRIKRVDGDIFEAEVRFGDTVVWDSYPRTYKTEGDALAAAQNRLLDVVKGLFDVDAA